MAATKKTTESSSFQRTMRVLDAVAHSSDSPRFADLERQLELPKATLNRLLNQLLDEDLVLLDERTQTYNVGYRLLQLARRSWDQMDIRRLAYDKLNALSELTNESVQLAVQADTEMVYVDCVECTQNVRLSVRIGDKIPIYCSSTGKAVLAFRAKQEQDALIKQLRFAAITPHTITTPTALVKELKRVKQQHYAIDREEHFVGVCCVASPILNTQGQPIAAISVAAPNFRVDEAMMQQWAKYVTEAADDIASRLPPYGL